MQKPLPVILTSVVLSGAISLLVVRTQSPPIPAVGGMESLELGQSSPDVTLEQLNQLKDQLAKLTSQLNAMQIASNSARRSVEPSPHASALVAGDETSGAAEGAAMSGSRMDPVFRAQVTEVLNAIEEEREAEEWEQELVERREEALDANAEYDGLNSKLAERVTELRDRLVLGTGQTKSLRSLLALQNDRNREMTHLWSQGKTSDEELGRIFKENRAAHRSEVLALLGREQLGTYRKYVREGGLGGRFSYFTAPWEDWKPQDGQ